MHKKNKKPWPTKDAMEQVYQMKLWGGNTHDFYSGEGSHHPDFVLPYINAVRGFLQSFTEQLTVCDLGCGDFNIGKQLLPFTQHYIAVDIVDSLIERNKQKFLHSNLTFNCSDIAKDPLPKADCVIIRQVLQHLSNAEITAIVAKLKAYKYIILTEHLPLNNFIANKDLISGQGIRLKKKSGVNLLISPFNLRIKEQTELLSIALNDNKGVIKTFLYSL